MDYTPHTPSDVRAMLAEIGVDDVEELFAQVPADLRLSRALDLPPAMGESDVYDLLESLAARNTGTDRISCFMGGGAYDHYIPAPVRHLAYRAEFATSYTPYQPELSQGVLGALFEFQTMISELSGLEVANASLYDGASALVEAVNLAAAVTERHRVVVSEAINPNHRRALETLGRGPGYELRAAPAPGGVTDVGDLDLDGAACLILGFPNFFGIVEDLKASVELTHEAGALLVVYFDPLAMGVLESPGALGADVVVGEGQPLGNPLSFGGPYLGLFATRMEHVRKAPGRIVGATVDVDGEEGFVLTLQAREQHIRREKATSNVCTNQTLMAIVATVYLSWLGPEGLREVGECCRRRAAHAAELLASVSGCSLAFEHPFFKEFVLRVPGNADDVVSSLEDKGFLVGPSLGRFYPELQDGVLVAVTERRTPEQVEGLAKALSEVVA